ncbi:MAG: GIY-YIG nuclease family protein [Candidatus Obscuribacterales bacterium]|nr:GIY-YIG nuclease family protein [Candidatus Obscuribacterales bacterium]
MDDLCYTYMIRCADGSLYTGWTTDLPGRIIMHNQGKGAKYTRSRLPVELVFARGFPSRSQAMSFEYELKSYRRSTKLHLAQNWLAKSN